MEILSRHNQETYVNHQNNMWWLTHPVRRVAAQIALQGTAHDFSDHRGHIASRTHGYEQKNKRKLGDEQPLCLFLGQNDSERHDEEVTQASLSQHVTPETKISYGCAWEPLSPQNSIRVGHSLLNRSFV
jgi:hypothetical protein